MDKRKYLLENYHGVSLTFIDHDELFESQSETIVVNDLMPPNAGEKEQREAAATFSRLIKTEISGSNFVSTPKCDCGNLHTQYDADKGNVCPKCNTVCIKRLHQDIRERCWIRAVNPAIGFIHPTLWMCFISTFSSFTLTKSSPLKTYDLLAWMCDPYYRPIQSPSKSNLKVQEFLENEIGFKRGLNNFIMGFDGLMRRLLEPDVFYRIQSTMLNRKGNKVDQAMKIEDERQWWLLFVERHRDKFFPKHLPLISDQLIITEEMNDEKQIDGIFLGMIDAAKTILSAYAQSNRRNVERIVTTRMVNANRLHAIFNFEFRREILFPKSGIIRSKNNRTRASYSGRATITATPYGHDYDTCVTPWRWTVNLLYLDILNKLLHKHDKTPYQALELIDLALNSYDEFIHEIIRELIAEAPGKGIMLVPLRNPTLVRLSVWVMYMTDVKTDVNDGSISISNLVIKQANADYDGDQIMVLMPRDNVMRRYAHQFRPALSLMSRTKINTVSGKLTLHAEVIANQNGFIAATVTDNEWDD